MLQRSKAHGNSKSKQALLDWIDSLMALPSLSSDSEQAAWLKGMLAGDLGERQLGAWLLGLESPDSWASTQMDAWLLQAQNNGAEGQRIKLGLGFLHGLGFGGTPRVACAYFFRAVVDYSMSASY